MERSGCGDVVLDAFQDTFPVVGGVGVAVADIHFGHRWVAYASAWASAFGPLVGWDEDILLCSRNPF